LFAALPFTAKDAKEKQRAAKKKRFLGFLCGPFVVLRSPLDKLGTGFAVNNPTRQNCTNFTELHEHLGIDCSEAVHDLTARP
jgi:hypothetical protein